MKAKTVVIMGTRVTDKSPGLAHPGADLWGMTHMNARHWGGTLNDWTHWFDLHPFEPTNFHIGLPNRTDLWPWLTSQDGKRPIYLQRADPRVRGSVTFPLADLQTYFGKQTAAKRFTTTADMLIAYAIRCGYTRIILTGIGVRGGQEYEFQHKGILFWLGYAEGRGIELVIEPPSVYLPSDQVYGYDIGAPGWAPKGARPHVHRNPQGYMKRRRRLQ